MDNHCQWKGGMIVDSKTKANQDIREYAKSQGVFLYEIAAQYGVNDITFTKKLRKELSTKDKKAILRIINTIAKKKGV